MDKPSVVCRPVAGFPVVNFWTHLDRGHSSPETHPGPSSLHPPAPSQCCAKSAPVEAAESLQTVAREGKQREVWKVCMRGLWLLCNTGNQNGFHNQTQSNQFICYIKQIHIYRDIHAKIIRYIKNTLVSIRLISFSCCTDLHKDYDTKNKFHSQQHKLHTVNPTGFLFEVSADACGWPYFSKLLSTFWIFKWDNAKCCFFFICYISLYMLKYV